MRIRVRVQPNARSPGIERLPDGTLRVRVSAPALDGRANQGLVRLLAEYYNVTPGLVRIVHGARSRSKLVEILERG